MRSKSMYVVKDALYGTSEVKENHKRNIYRKLV
jgi:DNA-binding CsgD family transcriptional regulator